MIEDVEWASHRLDVAGGVAPTGAGAEHRGRVVHVHVLVHDEDGFGPGHLPRAPDGVHHAPRLQCVLLADPDEGAVVEGAEHRQVVVLDVRHQRAQERQEHPLGRLAEVVVFLRRQTDDDRGVDRIAAVRDRRHLQQRVTVGHGIEPGVIAERSLERGAGSERAVGARVVAHVTGVVRDVALDDDLGVGGDAQGHGDSARHANTGGLQETGHQELAHARRQRGRGRVRQHGRSAQDDRHRHALAALLPAAPVGGAVVVDVPVHGHDPLAQELDAVHADIVAWRFGAAGVVGVDGVHAGDRDVAPAKPRVPGLARLDAGDAIVDIGGISHRLGVAIKRPAPDHRQSREVDAVAGVHDLLARARTDRPGRDLAQWCESFQKCNRLGDRPGQFGLDQIADLRGQRLEPAGHAARGDAEPALVAPQRDLRAPIAPERVDEHRPGRTLDVLEQQGGAAGGEVRGVGRDRRRAGAMRRGRLAHAIGDLGDLKDRINRNGDPLQLAGPLQSRDKLTQVRVH